MIRPAMSFLLLPLYLLCTLCILPVCISGFLYSSLPVSTLFQICCALPLCNASSVRSFQFPNFTQQSSLPSIPFFCTFSNVIFTVFTRSQQLSVGDLPSSFPNFILHSHPSFTHFLCLCFDPRVFAVLCSHSFSSQQLELYASFDRGSSSIHSNFIQFHCPISLSCAVSVLS